VLRTVFRNDLAEEPLQVVLKEGIIDFRVEDLSSVSEIEQQQQLQKIAQRYQDKGFDYEKENLFRLIVVKLGNSYELIWQQHHLILDGWSNALLLGEYNRLINPSSKNEKLSTPYRFSNYIEYIEKLDRCASKKYWTKYLEDNNQYVKILPLEINNLPFKKCSIEDYLDETTFQKLNLIATERKITINTIFSVCWAISIEDYFSEYELLFGAVVSGRSYPLENIENMIGIFINTIPRKVKITKNKKIIELFNEYQNDFNTSYNYHNLSLAEIQSFNRYNNIDHLLIFENYPNQGENESLDFNEAKVKTHSL